MSRDTKFMIATAVAFGGLIVGLFYDLGGRIDALEVSLNKRIADTNDRIRELGTSLNKRIDDTNDRIQALEASLNKRIDDTNDRIRELGTGVNRPAAVPQAVTGELRPVRLGSVRQDQVAAPSSAPDEILPAARSDVGHSTPHQSAQHPPNASSPPEEDTSYPVDAVGTAMLTSHGESQSASDRRS